MSTRAITREYDRPFEIVRTPARDAHLQPEPERVERDPYIELAIQEEWDRQ